MKDPFDNNWKTVEKTPVDEFKSCPFKEVLSWAESWDLEGNAAVIARLMHPDGKIEERAFKSHKEAEKVLENFSGEYTAYDQEYLQTS